MKGKKLLPTVGVALSFLVTAHFTAGYSLAGLPRVFSTASVVFPLLSPKLSSHYGKRKHPVYRLTKHHNGVDLAAPRSAHVRAVLPGKVVFADRVAGYGKLVTVDHGQGYVSLYGHLSEIRVNPGQQVSAGELLGRVGSTGIATGPHLHFEWREKGLAVDPLKVFPHLASAQASG